MERGWMKRPCSYVGLWPSFPWKFALVKHMRESRKKKTRCQINKTKTIPLLPFLFFNFPLYCYHCHHLYCSWYIVTSLAANTINKQADDKHSGSVCSTKNGWMINQQALEDHWASILLDWLFLSQHCILMKMSLKFKSHAFTNIIDTYLHLKSVPQKETSLNCI